MANIDRQKAAQNVKKLLRIAPHPEVKGDGFVPSDFARWVAVDSKTDYHPIEYEKYTGNRKVLVLCTEERYMTMGNGKKFSTGNHPIETMLPMMHLQEAGFQFDICTPRGVSVKMEMWAMPELDMHIQEFFKANYTQFENPMSLAEIVTSLNNESPYVAVFVPGGHGAMLGLPESEDVGKLISWVKETDRYLITLCHGPAALLAAKDINPYKDYKICAFPDGADKARERIGYTPGPMPWLLCEKLQEVGFKIVNRRAGAMVQKDRKLLTGASAKAANALGKLAADCILAELSLLEDSSPSAERAPDEQLI
jgi:molecular chaperone Hsp31 and glyoxalase 3